MSNAKFKTLTNQDLEKVALFPLPNAVLFPSTILPLHIFEQRYRTMTREALEDNLPIVICKMLDPRQYNAHGQPLFNDVAGVGFIHNHQLLPDGRYNILLGGTHRVKIIEELHDTGKPYRVGHAEIIQEKMDITGAINALVTTLQHTVDGLKKDYTMLARALGKLLDETPNPASLADSVASLILSDPDMRQRMLEEPQVEQRLDTLITQLAALLNQSPDASPQRDPWLN